MFSDDPECPDPNEECVQPISTPEFVIDHNLLDPKHYCSCGQCQKMKTVEESVCCKVKSYLQTGGDTYRMLPN